MWVVPCLSEGSRGEPFLASSRFWGQGNPGHFLACSCGTPVSASVFTGPPSPVCLCVISSPYKDISHWIRSTLILYDLILTNHICKHPISKHSPMLTFLVNVNFGGTLLNLRHPLSLASNHLRFGILQPDPPRPKKPADFPSPILPLLQLLTTSH